MSDPQKVNPRTIVFCVAFGALVFLLLFLRRPDALLNAQFWAEDGGVFFQDQTVHGLAGSLLRPYSGYIHMIPRLIAALVCQWPVRWVPLSMNLCTLFIESVCLSAFCWPCYRKIIASDALRAACCLIAATATVAGSELIGTLSNLQWFLCVLSLLLLFVESRSRTREFALALLQVLIAFTAPVTLLYIPILLWQIRSHPRMLKIRPTLHLIALLLQLWIMRSGVAQTKPIIRFSAVFAATVSSGVSRCLLSPLLGSAILPKDSDVVLFTQFAVALLLGGVILGVLAIKLRGSHQQLPMLIGAYVGVGSLLLVLWGRGLMTAFLTVDAVRHYSAERYFFIGTCMFIFCAALAIDYFTRAATPLLPAALLIAMFAWGAIHNFKASPFSDLNWPESAAKIEAWKSARQRRQHPEKLILPINPNLHVILEEQ